MAVTSKQIHEVSTSRNGNEGKKQQGTNHPSFRERLNDYLRWENLTVAGREVKGFVVPQWMAVVLLGTFVSVMGAMYKSFSWEMSWQHDQLIILSTQKTDAEKLAAQEHSDRALEASSNQAWREKMTNDMAELRRTVKEQSKERN